MPTWRRARAYLGLVILVAMSAVAGCSSDPGPSPESQTSGRSTAAPSPGSSSTAPQRTEESSEGTGEPDLDVAEPGSEEAKIAALFGPDFLPRSGGSFGLDRIHRIPGKGPDGSAVLRVDYPARSASGRAARSSGDRDTQGGAQVYLLLRRPVDSLQLRYCFRFPVGFNFVKGGKLPGLFGGTVNNGQKIPDGTNGWSTRYMWRKGGAGEVYAYLPSSVKNGTSLGRGNWRVTPGVWQCLDQAVTLNTPGKADGTITVSLDGRQVFQKAKVIFRTTDSLRIDGVFFSTFFGGGDASWASPTDQYVDFADFSVGE